MFGTSVSKINGRPEAPYGNTTDINLVSYQSLVKTPIAMHAGVSDMKMGADVEGDEAATKDTAKRNEEQAND